ncbi:MAG TPA: carbonic anhydrase family protein [Flavobacterium sp.]|jgi:carbonic anhydrase|nr:carbonic anhydrase family protein [Flavobacterium sp.]
MKSKTKKIIVFVSILLSFYSIQAQVTKSTDSTKTNEIKATAPDSEVKKQQGYALPGLDHGFEQSPINIVSAKNKEGKHKVTMHYQDKINKIENLGHTVQLDFEEGSTITQDDTTFVFKQCHFHTPSEHLIDGLTYPMEMHIVNIMPNENKSATPQYLVIGVLFKEGKENKFIADFLDAIPKEEHGKTQVNAGKVKLADLIGKTPNKLMGHYYYYRGSLTTPPFTESVRWYVTKHIFEASAQQIEAINKIEGNNARHVQASYGRVVSSK